MRNQIDEEYKGYSVFVERSADRYNEEFEWSVSKDGDELESGYEFDLMTGLGVAMQAVNRLLFASEVKGLFVYNAGVYSNPIDAHRFGALSCVEGWEKPEQVPTVADMQLVMNSVSKAFTFSGSCFTVVYIDSGNHWESLDQFEPQTLMSELTDFI